MKPRVAAILLLVGVALLAHGCPWDDDPVTVGITASPVELERGTTTALVLTADSEIGHGGPTVEIAPAPGLTLGVPTKTGATTVSLDVTVADDAPLGPRIVTLTTHEVTGQTQVTVIETSVEEATFTCAPASVKQGESATISVIGVDTHFTTASTLAATGDATGVTLGALTVTDATHAAFDVQVAGDAALGSLALTITTGAEIATGSLLVDQGDPEPTPSIVVEPDSMQAGDSGTIVITGTDTHLSGESAVSLGAGVAVLDVIYSEPEDVQMLIVSIEVDAAAAPGARTLTVTSPFEDGNEIVETGFEILPGPSMTVSPTQGNQGEVVAVQLIGANTSFATTGSLVEIEHATDDAASGVQIDVTNIVPPSLIEADVTIAEDGTPGAWTISVTTGDELVNAAFTVNEVVLSPSLIAVPSEGWGGDSLTVELFGTDTSFVDGTTSLASDSTDLAITGYVVDDVAQQITAQVEIAPDAIEQFVLLTATTGEEVVGADFTVHAAIVDCNDFTFEPAELSIGRFGKSLLLERSDSGWIMGESVVSIVGEPAHMRFGNVGDAPEDRCYVSTGFHITCGATVGVYATPGTYQVTVTTGAEVLCGQLTIVADDIGTASAPGGGLPGYLTYLGAIDATGGDRSDFYEVDVVAGDALIFHAYSLDRDTLDPVLRLIEPTGDDWLVFEDDETSMGIDARLPYWFAAGGTYVIEVGPKGDAYYGTGDYRLHTYRLTHGATIAEAAAENGDFATAQDLGSALSEIVYGTIDVSTDVDVYRLDAAGPIALDVAARRIGDYDGAFSDAKLTVYSTADTTTPVATNLNWNETPGTADARIFLAAAGSYYIVVEPQAGSTGFYGLNVRPRVVINEIDNRSSASDPFVELVGPASFSLADYELCTYGADGAPVDASAECVPLTGFTTSFAGYRALYASDFTQTTLDLPAGAGAVVLKRLGATEDAVQYGTLASGSYAEGTAAEIGTSRCIGRGANVDTDNNKLDFIYMASPTAGMPNDRTFQSAVPLYGETAG